MKKTLALMLLALTFTTAFTGIIFSVRGATQADIDNAINYGVAWLASQQSPSGSWPGAYPIGATGLALLKLETHAVLLGMSPFDPNYIYNGNVSKGLDYLFTTAVIIPINIQTHGLNSDNPDSNGNGIGVWFPGSGENNYQTALALIAIVSSTTPNKIVTVGPLSGWTYLQVAQDVVDYFAFAQSDSGPTIGGWYYTPLNNAAGGDQSNAGFVCYALLFAEAPLVNPPKIGGFGITIPTFVKTLLNSWIGYIQNTGGGVDDGGAGYTDSTTWVNMYKTGHLLQQMSLVGDTATTPRVMSALAYLERHWNETNQDPGWKGPPASYLATLMVMKGLLTLGIQSLGGMDWFDDFANTLIAQQNADGSWPVTLWGDQILSTEWALLTLQKAVPEVKHVPPVGGQVVPTDAQAILSANATLIMASIALFAAAAAVVIIARKKY